MGHRPSESLFSGLHCRTARRAIEIPIRLRESPYLLKTAAPKTAPNFPWEESA